MYLYTYLSISMYLYLYIHLYICIYLAFFLSIYIYKVCLIYFSSTNTSLSGAEARAPEGPEARAVQIGFGPIRGACLATSVQLLKHFSLWPQLTSSPMGLSIFIFLLQWFPRTLCQNCSNNLFSFVLDLLSALYCPLPDNPGTAHNRPASGETLPSAHLCACKSDVRVRVRACLSLSTNTRGRCVLPGSL